MSIQPLSGSDVACGPIATHRSGGLIAPIISQNGADQPRAGVSDKKASER